MPPGDENSEKSGSRTRSTLWGAACLWVPTLYFAQGLPNTLVDQIAPVFLKDLRLDNALITAIGAWAYLPWTLKALWSPLVDGFGKKRAWIVSMQLAVSGALVALALAIALFAGSAAFPWLAVGALALIAAASATHDIAADGFYMLALDSGGQAIFSGVRSTFFRLAGIFGKGGIIALAGAFIASGDVPGVAWTKIVFALAGLIALIAATHFFVLPRPACDVPAARSGNAFANFAETWRSFFRKKELGTLVAFLLIYRLGEVQLGAVSSLFFKDSAEFGGLGIGNIELGILSGTLGTGALLAGGIVAGICVAWRGLKFWLWTMLVLLNLPDLIYVAFAHWRPENSVLLGGGIAAEQFGYGFGFTGYMLYMLFACREGAHRVAHYAICTGIMALGAMLPRFWCGALQDFLGYEAFFGWAILCGVPAFFVVRRAMKSIPADFGRKK